MTEPGDDDDRTRIVPPTAAKPAAVPSPTEAYPPTQRVGAPPPTQQPPMPASTSASAASSAGDSGNALPIGTYIAEFEITRVIGEGGFGIVYDAWDHSLQRRVALKEYMPSSLASREDTEVKVRSQRHRETFVAGLRSFVNEARLLAQFDHPSLVKVYRFWEAHGTAYMVMPLYQGITLKDRLREMHEPPDENWLMGMLAPLTEALAVIHHENCFHRDIAPDNIILLAGSERPLLLDFGAARRVIGDMTQALTVILKPGYAPVEQYAETPHMKQGSWTDVYALAASVHYAIMRKTPPPSVSRLITDSFVPLVQAAEGRYSPTFLRALDNALRVKPDERTQTIAELRADMGLDEWAASQPQTRIRTLQPLHQPPRTTQPPAPPAAPPPRTVAAEPPVRSPAAATPAPATPATFKPVGSRTGLYAGIGVGAAAAIAVGLYMTMSGGKPKPAPVPPVVMAPPPAAASPTPAPAPPPVVTTFEAQAEFDKVMAAQTPGFDVGARALKPQLRIGRDKLGFEVTSSRDGYLYVLLIGPDRSLTRLVPNDMMRDARIKAGQKLVLPQASWPLDASEPPGPEHFLVIVSTAPRDHGELLQGPEYIFRRMANGAQAAQIAARWPAKTPPLLGVAQGCNASAADCETYGAAQFSLEVVR